MNVSILTETPIVLGVLTCTEEAQAVTRSTGDKNQGNGWGELGYICLISHAGEEAYGVGIYTVLLTIGTSIDRDFVGWVYWRLNLVCVGPGWAGLGWSWWCLGVSPTDDYLLSVGSTSKPVQGTNFTRRVMGE